MSAEAVLAVRKHASGSDAQRRLLEVLADWANPRGIAYDIRAEDLAAAMGKKKGGISGVKVGLKDSGQLVVVEEETKRHGATYLIALPGLSTPEEAEVEPEPIDPPKRPEKIQAKVWREFWEAAYPYFPEKIEAVGGEPLDPRQMVALDAMELLGQKRKVDKKLVTTRELALAAVCLITFNREFEWKDPQTGEVSKESDYGLGANLTEIVMRVRDRPSWDADAWVRLVQSAWRIRWWEKRAGARRPTPSVIWSPKSFEQVVQDAIAESKSKKGTQKGGRRFTRSVKDE